MQEIIFPKPKLHLFMCINDRTTIPGSEKSSCGPRIGHEQVKELKQWLREEGLTMEVFCTKAQCLGFCNPDSSVAVLYPKGIFVKYQTIDELKELILREVKI